MTSEVEEKEMKPSSSGVDLESALEEAERRRHGNAARFYQFAEQSYEHAVEEMIEHKKCDQCFLTRRLCVCSKVQEIFAGFPSIKSHVSIFMHFKEWGRASNTGKVLLVGNRSHSSLYIYGRKDDERELIRRMCETPSLIVYPKKGISRPIHEYNDWFKAHDGNVLICAIDSTWSQSEAMEKVLPR